MDVTQLIFHGFPGAQGRLLDKSARRFDTIRGAADVFLFTSVFRPPRLNSLFAVGPWAENE